LEGSVGQAAGIFGQAAGLGIQGFGAYSQYQSAKAQGDYEKRVLMENARQAELQAQDARRRGDIEASAQHRETQELLARQRVAAVSQGIAPNFGSAAELQGQALALGRADEATIRMNAAREVYGFRSQSLEFQSQGSMAKKLSRLNARSSLWLSGAKFATDAGSLAYKVDRSGKE
jgi:hypothetical protein